MTNFLKIPLLGEIKQDTTTPYAEVTPSTKRNKTLTDFNNPVLPVIHQGQFPTCVGTSGKKICESFFKNNELLSAIWLYKQAQIHDEYNGENYAGTSIYGATLALKNVGICTEELIPYKEQSYNNPIPDNAKEDAKNRKIYSFLQVNKNIDEIISIVNEKPLWIIIPVHENFYFPNNGIISTNYTLSNFYGNHALLLTGYKTINDKLHFILQNSWGLEYGHEGFCYVDAEEFVNYVISIYCIDNKNTEKPNFISKILSSIVHFFKSLFAKI